MFIPRRRRVRLHAHLFALIFLMRPVAITLVGNESDSPTLLEREDFKNNLGCTGIGASFLVFCILVSMAGQAIERGRFLSASATCIGVIRSVGRVRDVNGLTYQDVYTFVVDGSTYQGIGIGTGKEDVGDPVTVRYLPSAPKQSELDGRDKDLFGKQVLLGIVFLLCLLIGRVVHQWIAMDRLASVIELRSAPEKRPDDRPDQSGTSYGDGKRKPESHPAQTIPLDDIPLNDLPVDRSR